MNAVCYTLGGSYGGHMNMSGAAVTTYTPVMYRIVRIVRKYYYIIILLLKGLGSRDLLVGHFNSR